MAQQTIKLQRIAKDGFLGRNDVLYVENQYDQDVNCFIRSNYFSIRDAFTSAGLNFIYVPLVSEGLIKFTGENKGYTPLTTTEYIDLVFNGQFPETESSLLIRVDDPFDSSHDTFLTIPVTSGDLDDPDTLAADIADRRGTFRPVPAGFEPITPRNHYEPESVNRSQLSVHEPPSSYGNTVQDIIDMMQASGVTLQMLQIMMARQSPLSRIEVNEDFLVTLSDYGITLDGFNPMEQTVYLLFLNHPEGIMLSCLSDFRGEMKMYYSTIKGNDYGDAIPKPVMSATDPLNESGISPHLSRINKQVRRALGDSLNASPYMILRDRKSGKHFINYVKDNPDNITWL